MNAITSIFEKDNTTLETFECFKEGAADRSRLDYLLELNKGGRRILQSQSVPNSLWPLVLGRSSQSKDVLFHFLRQKPDILLRAGSQQNPSKTTTGKRKRDDLIGD